ncbi:MAG: hypothetical protein ACYTEZ_14345 [Planctomycetota bacterium]|jgi:hypothetical protein
MVEDGVLRTAAFKEFSKDYVMFLHITTMIEGREDDDLLMRIGGTAFPHLVVMDVDGSVIREHRAAPTVEAFRETGEAGRQRLALRASAAAGDRDAILKLAFARADGQQITSKRLRREVARAGRLTAEEQERFAKALTGLLFAEAEVCAQGAWYLRMEKEGLVPQEVEPRTQFYVGILKWAEFQEDAAIYGRALEEMRKMHGEEPRAESFFRMARRKLAQLEEIGAEK